MQLHHDGYIRGTVDGVEFVAPVMRGSAAEDAYMRFHAAAFDLHPDGIAGIGAQESGVWIRMARLFLYPDIRQLLKETLNAVTAKGAPLSDPKVYDAVFAGKPSLPSRLGMRLWHIQGFFSIPGVPVAADGERKPTEPTPAPAPLAEAASGAI